MKYNFLWALSRYPFNLMLDAISETGLALVQQSTCALDDSWQYKQDAPAKSLSYPVSLVETFQSLYDLP